MTTHRAHALHGALLFALLAPTPSALGADTTKLVRYACDAAADRLVVTLVYAAVPEGAALEPDAFDPFDLIVIEGDSALESKSVERTCGLSDGDYVVQVEGVAGNHNINGRCGAWSTARVAIRRAGESLFDDYLETHCHDYDGTVIDRVEVAAGAAQADVHRVPFETFNDW